MRTRHTVLGFLLATAVPAIAGTQALPSAVIQQINAAGRLRVQLTDRHRGTLYGPRADSTSLTFDHGVVLNRGGSIVELPQPVSIDHIARIEVGSGSHARNGALIGGVIGAGLALLATAACDGSVCQSSAGDAGAALVGWTAVGAGVGALIGSAIPRWRTVYPVP